MKQAKLPEEFIVKAIGTVLEFEGAAYIHEKIPL